MNLENCFQDNYRKMYKEGNVALFTTGDTWQLFVSYEIKTKPSLHVSIRNPDVTMFESHFA